MIQRANDPNASRQGWRPEPQGGRPAAQQVLRRPGHAWPFISRQAQQPDRPVGTHPSSNDSGS